MFQVRNLKRFFEGAWYLKRQIEDRRAEDLGRFAGNAAFRAVADGLQYREEGRLAIGGHAGPAVQFYAYTFPAKGRAEVCFRDGRPFHDLDLTRGRWAAVHLCDPDRYEGAFTALDADHWRVVWRIVGPRKDLILDSSYRRAL